MGRLLTIIDSRRYDAASQAAFAAMTVKPTLARRKLYDDLIAGLKIDGVWPLIDRIGLIAAHDAQAARVDLKTGTEKITLVDAPTFTADAGYATDGSNDALDLGYDPATNAVNFTQNGACFFVWYGGANAQSDFLDAGWFDGTDGVGILARRSTDDLRFRINQAAASIVASITESRGFVSANRSGANSTELYKGGVELTVGTNPDQASTALNSVNLRLGNGAATNFAARTYLAWGAAGSLDATKQLALYDRLSAYLTAIGAV